MNEFAKLAKDYLEKPYKRVLTPDEETGSYTAEILEFPGCVAQGDTVEEAYANLEAAAESWIEVALDVGQQIPEPASEGSYSGKVALRMPKSLHRRASQAAGEEGTSLNQFIVAALAEQVGANGARSHLVEEVEKRVAFAQECEQRSRRMSVELAANMYPSLYTPETTSFNREPSTFGYEMLWRADENEGFEMVGTFAGRHGAQEKIEKAS